MKKLSLLICTTFSGLCVSQSVQAADKKEERPNILWLTFEDTSSYELGCYGNTDVHTPNIDTLAANGVQFMNAWSVAPQSSAARSSLITGCYATTYGMDVHPVPYDTPADIFFPQRLREAGYYCTNNNKTHYNSTTDHTSCWDDCSKTASYNNPERGENQPFFAVFNSLTSHMGRVRTFHTDGRRDYTKEGIHPALLKLPSYVPDLPEVRSDYAGHLEAVQDVDRWVGIFLNDLKEKGLDGNTIIFVFSDHGGCIPRGKGYLYESGLRVPLIVYFPPKWQHLAGELSEQVRDLVGFTDLGPTVMSLANIKPDEKMQGNALFGKYASKEKHEFQFAIAANQLHHFMPVRAVSNGRYKYIRSYIPYRQFALRNYYQWGMPSNKAWDAFVLGGHNVNPEWDLTFDVHPAEMLFDLENDPGEINDLSAAPEHAEMLATMRKAMSEHIRTTMDLGFFLPTSRVGHVLYDKVRKEKYPLEELYRLVEIAGTAKTSDLEVLEEACASPLPDMRFWAAVGYATLAREKHLTAPPQALLQLLEDENPYIASEAAYAVAYSGKPQKGIARLVTPVHEEERKIGYSLLECLSMDRTMQQHIRSFLPELKEAAERLPRVENEDAGLMARGILVNLGEMNIKDMYGAEAYKKGLQLNRGRRALGPLPFGKTFVPLSQRVNVQQDSARMDQVIDGNWVAVGIKKEYAIGWDHTHLFQGKPSFHFELKQEDNTLEGYSKGETKGRAELSYCYATSADFEELSGATYANAQKMKTVYHYGKGSCSQGGSMGYRFSVYIPATLSPDVSTIFAQWHGMPSRTLVSDPDGRVMQLTVDQFLDLERRMIFKKNIAYDKKTSINAKGDTIYKAADKPNGWIIEQGGYPPLAFGFSQGCFYIKANSDRKWLSDKDDRCNANVRDAVVMNPVTSTYKASTIAYKMPFEEFPKECWITFDVLVDWTRYGGESETVIRPGCLDVTMSYMQEDKQVSRHVVDNEELLIGRNDEDGYYFKFGIYRVGNSAVPISYNLAGYKEYKR